MADIQMLNMEQIMDVSWMSHEKDTSEKDASMPRSSPLPARRASTTDTSSENRTPTRPNNKTSSAASPAQNGTPPNQNQNGNAPRPGIQPVTEKNAGTPPTQRRPSWFSNMASRFSASPSPQLSSAQGSNLPDPDEIAPLPKISPNKNAVLPHAVRQTGDAPYTPAPPKSSQPSFLGVLRRLSSSNGVVSANTRANHGLVERKVLNVDKHRQRCRVNELSQAKLRRVAFCVDVEIAPMPKYADGDPKSKTAADKAQKRKLKDQGEAEALKHPDEVKAQKEHEGIVKATGEHLPKEPEKEGTETASGQVKAQATTQEGEQKPEPVMTRKKEKKKKSEAERKAKKEQKRKEALEKGAIPMEIHLDSDSSSEEVSSGTGLPKPQVKPTANPVRIYRRCCQLRETDILTKITHQLPKSTEDSPDGLVEKLDLTDYLLTLRDLATLGDFLAVVPIREVILENCGLTDEGIRVILAGLLAARKPQVKYRRSIIRPADLVSQGGVVERLVLKNNEIGVEGWKHIGLFIHLCRSIKSLDLSKIPFPAPPDTPKTPLTHHFHIPHGSFHATNNAPGPLDISQLLSRAIGERLAGSALELINFGATGMTGDQLGVIVDGMLKAGIIRLGLSHNNLDEQGVRHVSRYLKNAKCEGIDLGGNDLRRHLEIIAGAIDENSSLWAISLANCNLEPSSLCKIFPNLAKLSSFKFLDLSHNQALFQSEPSALGLLRRYLPMLDNMRKLLLADVSMSPEQAIALAEILPEVKALAHINLLENPGLAAVAEANTEGKKEEACALYASLLAAARVSRSLIKVDVVEPSSDAGELVKALANQIVAYCMRNLQGVPDLRDSASGEPKYPDVLRHLVGYEGESPPSGIDVGDEPAPDDDYVIGGTGVVKALTCCLKNLGNDNQRNSDELFDESEASSITPPSSLHPGKARDMSKELLASARKIRIRLQPALAQARASASQDLYKYHRLLFLDQTIEGIIQRFENEFPETRQAVDLGTSPQDQSPIRPTAHQRTFSMSSADGDGIMTDTEEAGVTIMPSLSRSHSNSMLSHTSKALAEEEGQTLRAGHRFRRNFLKPEHYGLLTSTEELKSDPAHTKLIVALLEELGEDDEELQRKVEEQGAVRTFQENRELIVRRLCDKDPQYWASFIEAQQKARANVKVGTTDVAETDPTAAIAHQGKGLAVDEQAIED